MPNRVYTSLKTPSNPALALDLDPALGSADLWNLSANVQAHCGQSGKRERQRPLLADEEHRSSPWSEARLPCPRRQHLSATTLLALHETAGSEGRGQVKRCHWSPHPISFHWRHHSGSIAYLSLRSGHARAGRSTFVAILKQPVSIKLAFPGWPQEGAVRKRDLESGSLLPGAVGRPSAGQLLILRRV